MNRRTFLASSCTALPAAPAAAGPPKRIAAILTEHWLGSHADVVIGKYLEGYIRADSIPRSCRAQKSVLDRMVQYVETD